MSHDIYTQSNESLAQLVEEVKLILNKDQVNADSTLAELGFDSLNVIELVVACEQIYTEVMNPEDLVFDEFTTLIGLHQQLAGLPSE